MLESSLGCEVPTVLRWRGAPAAMRAREKSPVTCYAVGVSAGAWAKAPCCPCRQGEEAGGGAELGGGRGEGPEDALQTLSVAVGGAVRDAARGDLGGAHPPPLPGCRPRVPLLFASLSSSLVSCGFSPLARSLHRGSLGVTDPPPFRDIPSPCDLLSVL